MLKEDHSYYFQIQMQMLVGGRMYCDFVVWPTKDLFTQRISRDAEFCGKMITRCADFFRCVLVPEICFRYWSQKSYDELTDSITCSDEEEDVTDESFCYCKGPESGNMVKCDNESCKYKWFHFACVT
ncbi:unnamed protein product [Ixodes hexagonus]